MDKEKAINEIMKDIKCTREEAERVYKIESEMIKPKAYVSTEKNKQEKKPRIVQVSQEKQDLFNLLWEGLSNYYDNCAILTNNKLISVQIGEKTFKIDIIEQRNPKK